METNYGNIIYFTTLDSDVPVISTKEVTEVRPTTATCGGEISSDRGSAVIARGVCWNSTESPTALSRILCKR